MSESNKKLLVLASLVVFIILAARYNRKGNVLISKEDNYLVLNIAPEAGQALSVTGWRIASGVGQATLGSASPLPLQGKINPESAIVISRPSKIIISPDHSPVGVSFRENKCVGILGTYQTFIPPLPLPLNPEETYNLCVESHKSDTDFFTNTWRVYLSKDKPLWREHDVLRLYNQENKLLDIEYSK